MFKFVGVCVVVGAVVVTAGVLGGFMSFGGPDIAVTSKGRALVQTAEQAAREKAAVELKQAVEDFQNSVKGAGR
jgi:hypothetical protein